MRVRPGTLVFDPMAEGGDVRPRGSGVHASDLYNSYYQRVEPKRYTADPMNRTLVAMGLGWEWQVERALQHAGIRAVRPPEFCSPEGIYFNPDLVIDNGSTRVGEIKFTRMSARTSLDDPKFGKWLSQAKVYCYHLEIPRATFIVGHVGGGYPRRGEPASIGEPCTMVTEVEFTARELREEWDMLVRHGRREGII